MLLGFNQAREGAGVGQLSTGALPVASQAHWGLVCSTPAPSSTCSVTGNKNCGQGDTRLAPYNVKIAYRDFNSHLGN